MVFAAWAALAGDALTQDSTPLHAKTSASPTGLRNMDYLKTVGGLPSMPGVSWVQKQPEPVDVHFAQAEDASRTDAPYNRGHILTRETPKGDLGVRFQKGDAVVTASSGESWPIARDTFESTYSAIPGGRMGQDGKFFKKALPVLGVQMHEPFSVTASWGNLEGKSGDWLIQYDEDGRDFGIVGETIFERTYRRLPMTADLQARLASMRARAPKR
jgi:hypothetical protein